MRLTVVGSVALDTVETPWGRNDDGLGGAAVYFSLAASLFTRVHLVGVIGEDFPQRHVDLLASKDIGLAGLERAPGRTFRWAGRYHEDVNERDTLDTQLNVFEQFAPKLTGEAAAAPCLFLANIHPSLQASVLDQSNATFTGLDTMNLWINTTRPELEAVLRRVQCLIINDSEVKDLTGERNAIRAGKAIMKMGPSVVVVKKGEHGCLLFHGDDIFALPAFPLEDVIDPTGAGDSFAGGFMGYIARSNATDFETLKRAVVHGTVTASFTCEKFGPDRLAEVDLDAVAMRAARFHEIAGF